MPRHSKKNNRKASTRVNRQKFYKQTIPFLQKGVIVAGEKQLRQIAEMMYGSTSTRTPPMNGDCMKPTE